MWGFPWPRCYKAAREAVVKVFQAPQSASQVMLSSSQNSPPRPPFPPSLFCRITWYRRVQTCHQDKISSQGKLPFWKSLCQYWTPHKVFERAPKPWCYVFCPALQWKESCCQLHCAKQMSMRNHSLAWPGNSNLEGIFWVLVRLQLSRLWNRIFQSIAVRSHLMMQPSWRKSVMPPNAMSGSYL